MLQMSEQKYSYLFEESPSKMMILGADARIKDVNKAFLETLGYSRSQVVGKNALDFIVPEQREKAAAQIQAALNNGAAAQFEVNIRRKNGSICTLLLPPKQLALEEDGQPNLLVTGIDITERNLAEQALRAQTRLLQKYEEKLSALHQHALLLSSANNIDEILNLTLNAMEYALGFDVADIYLAQGDSLNVKRTRGLPMGLSSQNVDGRGLVAKAARSQATVRVSDTSKEADYVDRRGWDWTGPPTMLSELAVPLVIDGKTAGVLNVENTRLDSFNDKDQMLLETLAAHFAVEMQRLKHVQELQRSNQFLETIIENASVWINVLDNDNNVVIWNKAAEIISGYSREEVLGHRKIWSWLYPDDEYRKQITDSVGYVLHHGKTEQDVETNIRRKDGQARIISWNERNLLDEHGKVVGSIAIGRDITERRRIRRRWRMSGLYCAP